MSEDDPLDPALAELFRTAPVPEPPELARSRVLGRLEEAIPALGPPGLMRRGARVSYASRVGAKALALASASFVVGAIAGGLAVAILRPSPARVVYVDRAAAPVAPSVPVSSAIPPTSARQAPPDSLPTTSAPSVVPARPTPVSSSSGHSLAAERLLIDDARTKLAGGDPAAALSRLQEHARRFPHGKLDEEREALAVEALVQSSQYDAARARAELLRARWPESVFLPAVDATIQSIP